MTSTSPGVFVERALSWVRAAYPDGVPSADRSGLLRVLGARLTADELESLMVAMAPTLGVPPDEVTMATTGSGAGMDNVASMDMYRVAGRLASAGWPLAEVA